MKILDANSSDISIYFTRDEMDTCYHTGACDNGTYAILSINRDIIETIPIENARKALKVTGLDTHEIIDAMDNDTVYQYILWISAGNASENSDNEEFPSYDSITEEFEGIISTY